VLDRVRGAIWLWFERRCGLVALAGPCLRFSKISMLGKGVYPTLELRGLQVAVFRIGRAGRGRPARVGGPCPTSSWL
jgi:hypothetical protein